MIKQIQINICIDFKIGDWDFPPKTKEKVKKLDKSIEEFNEALRRAIHFRINPNFNYAEWKRASENIVWDETDDEEYGSQCNFSQKPKKPTDDEILEEVLKGCSREQIERIKKEGYYDPEKGIDIRPPSDQILKIRFNDPKAF